MITLGPLGTVLALFGWGFVAIVAPFAFLALVTLAAGALDLLLGTRQEMVAPGAAADDASPSTALAQTAPPDPNADDAAPPSALSHVELEAAAIAAARQAELEVLEAELSDDDWLVVLDLLRHDVPKDSIYRMMRLRYARRRGVAGHSRPSASQRAA